MNPCDDFYQFVCGKYPQEVPIPRDKDKTGTMDQMEHKVKMQLRGTFLMKLEKNVNLHQEFSALFEAPTTKRESSSSRLVKQFYRSCMDVPALQARGLEPLKRAVDDLGGWPASSDSWNQSGFGWEKANAALRSKYGVHALMIVTVDSDFLNNSKKMITVMVQ